MPTLHSDCDKGAGQRVVRVTRKAPRKSAATDLMNPAAAEMRSTIRTVLASWAGLVADERRLEPPAREISALARFLSRHVTWLSRHPAAGDMADEIEDLMRAACDIAYPSNIRRVHIGYCPVSDCDGELIAHIRPQDDIHPSEIVCSLSSAHAWPITWWSKLARQMRKTQGAHA